jgi:IclR family transcriptional regulator, pca regulon regulatory protein
VGSRLPAYCMSTGRVLLAALPDDALDRWLAELRPAKHTSKTIVSKRKLRESIMQARRDGWSMMDEEYEIGFRSLSVPIQDRSGATIAALNVCCPTPRVSLKTMRTEFLPLVQRAAETIRESLPEGLAPRQR